MTRYLLSAVPLDINVLTQTYSEDLLSGLPSLMALDMQYRQPNRIRLTTLKDYVQQRY